MSGGSHLRYDAPLPIIDIGRALFTVAGVGDMSGDVFGNGMLQERTIRLIAAFDHRDIFIDPDPDPDASFAERQRLFEQHWVPAAPDVIERDCERGDGALCATPTRLRFRALGTQTIDFP